MIYASDQDVKEALAHEIQRDVREDVWEYLIDRGFVEDVWAADAPIGELAEQYRKLAKLGKEKSEGQSDEKDAETVIGPDERLMVLSLILAKEAAQNLDVKWFRTEVLHGKLLGRDDVDDWIIQKTDEDGPHTVYLRFPIPADHLQEKHTYGVPWADPEFLDQESNPPIGWSQETLAYQATSSARGVSRVLVARDGVLGKLQSISERLTKSFDWTEDQATVFVLAGVPPMLSRARLAIYQKWGHGWMNRIQLDIDPTLSPRAVMKIYRQARAELGQSHYRPMTTKHLYLAEFYGGEKSNTWAELMHEWNKAHPDWTYSEARNFSRDCQHAWRRVTGQEKSEPEVRIEGHKLPTDSLELKKYQVLSENSEPLVPRK